MVIASGAYVYYDSSVSDSKKKNYLILLYENIKDADFMDGILASIADHVFVSTTGRFESYMVATPKCRFSIFSVQLK